MTTDEKLDAILAILIEIKKALPQPASQKPDPLSEIAGVDVNSIIDRVKKLSPGFYSSQDIAQICGVPGDKVSIIYMNRALIAKGARPAKSGARRGFRVGAWDAGTSSTDAVSY